MEEYINNSFIHEAMEDRGSALYVCISHMSLGRFVEKSSCISNIQSHRSMFVGNSDCVFSEMVFEEIYSLIHINPIQKK